MFNFLSKLSLDVWYKVILLLGFVLIMISVLFASKALNNDRLFYLGLGLFLISVGEWKNHKTVVNFKDANVCTGPAGYFKWIERHPDFVGVSLDFFGVLSLIKFIF